MGSIMQDFGEIPPDHLGPLERGEYSEELLPQSGEAGAEDDAELNGAGTFTYREWDCVRQRFREGFCTLRELGVPPGDEAFVTAAFETVLASPPTAAETKTCLAALAEWRTVLKEQKHPDPTAKARANLVGVLVNHNDFVTVR